MGAHDPQFTGFLDRAVAGIPSPDSPCAHELCHPGQLTERLCPILSAGLEKHQVMAHGVARPGNPSTGGEAPSTRPKSCKAMVGHCCGCPHPRALAVTVTLGQALEPPWPGGGVQTPRPASSPSRPSTEQTGQTGSHASQSMSQFSTTHTAYQVPSQETFREQTAL